MLCLSVSLQTVLRIWDCLFNEGSKIIFRVALTLIKQHQALILEATSFADVCEKFKELTRGRFVTECHTFMQVSVGAQRALRSAAAFGPRGRCPGSACLARRLSLCSLQTSASEVPFTPPSQAAPSRPAFPRSLGPTGRPVVTTHLEPSGCSPAPVP